MKAITTLVKTLLARAKGHKDKDIPEGYFVFHPDHGTREELSKVRPKDLTALAKENECSIRLLPDEKLAIIPHSLKHMPWAKNALQMAA